jgi:hypothetical protein
MHSLAATACAAMLALPVAGPIAWHAIGQSRQACTEIAETDVTILPHGFLLAHLDEFVTQDDVRPSPDGR